MRTEDEKLELLSNLGGMSLQQKWELLLDISAKEDVPSIDQLYQIQQLISLTPDGVKKVLVVGCGDGTEIKEFNDRGYEAVGIQVNKKANKEIRDKGLDAKDMDMHQMTFKNNKFDLVYAKDTFKQAISPTLAFAEFVRVSKKYILISAPSEEWAWKAHNYQLFTKEQFQVLGTKFKFPLLRNGEIIMPYVRQKWYLFKKEEK